MPDGTQIVNFPKLHSSNCTTKHQATNSWFKRTVRDTFVRTFNSIVPADLTTFRCANAIHMLLGNSPVTWNAGNCQAVLSALRELWIKGV